MYERFCRRMLDGGLVDYFEEYPVAARLTGTVATLWVVTQNGDALDISALSAVEPEALRIRGPVWKQINTDAMVRRTEELEGQLSKNCRDVLPNAERIDRDIDVALETTARVGVTNGPDHLCCGNMGRAEILLEVGEHLKRPAIVERARKMAGAVVARANEIGAYALFATSSPSPHLYTPGFFQGTAGIGYSLLRFAFPGELPSVVAWR